MTNTKALAATIGTFIVAVLAAMLLWKMITFTANVDSETGKPVSVPTQSVVIYEDGSGVQYRPGTDQEIRTFPENTFAWDCATMGNKVCGPIRPE